MPTPADGSRELLPVIAFMRAAPGKREELNPRDTSAGSLRVMQHDSV